MIDGEKDIINRAIKGEASAFGLLYDYYQPQIYRFVYLKVGHREEAEDLTHQVFLESWRNISGYEFQGFAFSSWLYRAARNKVIDYYRIKKIHFDIEDVGENHPELKIEDDFSKKIDDALTVLKVRKAIKLLNPLEQDIIVLRFVEDMSPPEIAVIVEKTPEAVRLLQHRAIKKLREAIKNQSE